MDGPDRAMAYRIALGTGFRVNESRSLVPASFCPEGDRPLVLLKATDAKDRRKVEQPISDALAEAVRPWLADKPAGRPVLPLHQHTPKMIRRDLEAAGIACQDEAGFADFHSLRASDISALVATGADIKTVQTLTRHKKAVTTLTNYAKANPEDMLGAFRSLPNPSGGPSGAAATVGRAATGRISDPLATHYSRPLAWACSTAWARFLQVARATARETTEPPAHERDHPDKPLDQFGAGDLARAPTPPPGVRGNDGAHGKGRNPSPPEYPGKQLICES